MAVQGAWKAFWGTDLVNNVKPDAEDPPLQGTYEGTLKCEVGWGKLAEDGKPANSMTISLVNPRMVRESSDTTEWDLAPKEHGRIDVLQDQLLSAG